MKVYLTVTRKKYFVSRKKFLYPKESFCVQKKVSVCPKKFLHPQKSFCIPKKPQKSFCILPKKNILYSQKSGTRMHLRSFAGLRSWYGVAIGRGWSQCLVAGLFPVLW